MAEDRNAGGRRGHLASVAALRAHLATLCGGTSPPRVHVNGPRFPHALLAVDFGRGRDSRPPVEVRDGILVLIRAAARDVSGGAVEGSPPVRVHMDGERGVWWAAI